MSDTLPHFEYSRGTLYNLTRAMLGEDAAEHGYRVAERLLNAGASWGLAAIGQIHDLAEDTDLSVEDVAHLVSSTSLNYMEQDYLSDEIRKALDGVTRRDGEVYADFIERIRATSDLAVAIKLADLRDNLGRCSESLAKRYRKALERLEVFEPTRDEMRDIR
jgi:(p)ppGpp synthase/HD superfamily hydrolase